MQEMTERLGTDAAGLARAAALLRAGRLVAFPTETVYGLGGDARQDTAVAAIYAAKGRPQFNPLIVHVADMEMAEQVAVFSDQARDLAARFWPGPLTLVLPARPEAGISDLVTAGLATVAVRMPAHPVARALLAAFGGPLAAPSANPSGKVSPTEADHVLEGLSGRIAAVVDGGACPVGVESTILGLAPPVLLRPGGVDVETLEKALGQPLAFGGDAVKPNAPGQLVSHYAPGAAVRLDATEKRPGEIYLGFGPGPEADLTLSVRADPVEAATRLFAMLRVADKLATARGAATIAIAPIPETGLGRAINDRLRRAAAPRG
ncbi:L-threonylcarbamoyladenylate synthase [Rhodobacter capsulatus]|jgi:L-threonylcarbamoyladenylate synthase|uniref:Threonylcarbamoyl-AMP synthase n=1 Tax=Rhodobacter capsulatus (strain ATCC BAA-309 / NBRC 16581 / SB1003) TaxID=272942 RepID=D5AM99_RHOCB|nr:L-threonylcarbamoyladenylate synthase [Rhodobacter capsulatus]ADE84169.1 Sua5/YciO/YrdC/YwlC family protein [Rhodobacter capsulatus SB 1003]ETD03272.1 translation factor Sua5 [Rhodobacter capsulatus DE442]ETD79541.1 translation factor Sua5 [Rhodobacter capsulatus R121]ETE55331.1 translation factor Sua5 [Rhodobacter capsulatus Y262]MDS0925853.1 L-threonylcarbamoyladenylate synthase [Rhodobacter capsulatus]